MPGIQDGLILPKVKLVSERTGLPWLNVKGALSGPTIRIPCYIQCMDILYLCYLFDAILLIAVSIIIVVICLQRKLLEELYGIHLMADVSNFSC